MYCIVLRQTHVILFDIMPYGRIIYEVTRLLSQDFLR